MKGQLIGQIRDISLQLNDLVFLGRDATKLVLVQRSLQALIQQLTDSNVEIIVKTTEETPSA